MEYELAVRQPISIARVINAQDGMDFMGGKIKGFRPTYAKLFSYLSANEELKDLKGNLDSSDFISPKDFANH